MNIKFKPISQIKSRLGIEKYGKAHKYFAERCRQHMNDKYVPSDKGALTQTSFIDSTCSIVYPQAYAHYQYIGKLYVDPKYKKGAFYNENYGFWSRKGVKKEPTNRDLVYKKAGTGAYWDKQMKSVEIKNIEKEVQKYVRRGCK